MKKQTFIIALLLAGLFAFSASTAEARGFVRFGGVGIYVAPPVVYNYAPVYPYGYYNYGYSAPVVVAPPAYVYYDQVPVQVIWYPDYGCYGYFNAGVFFGWHGGEHRFIRGYRVR